MADTPDPPPPPPLPLEAAPETPLPLEAPEVPSPTTLPDPMTPETPPEVVDPPSLPPPKQSPSPSHETNPLAILSSPSSQETRGETPPPPANDETIAPPHETIPAPPAPAPPPATHPFFLYLETNKKGMLLEPFQTTCSTYIKDFDDLMMAIYGTNSRYSKYENSTNSLHISLPQLPSHELFPSTAGYNKKTSKQHLYWNAIQYLALKFRSWSEYFQMIPLDSCVICKNCSQVIGCLHDFCFFLKSKKEVSFILQPKLNRDYQKNKKLNFDFNEKSNPKKKTDVGVVMYDILCPNCSTMIGKDTSHGPQKSRLFEFGNDKISIPEFDQYHSLKWSILNQLPEFHLIQRFDVECVSERDTAGTRRVPPRLVLPSREEDFGWVDLINAQNLHPRSEQLKAFHRALLWNSIVMLPTGAGKTLIASLTLARFSKLNPGLLTVMVVDRVPLVHQQKNCIVRDVFLRVYPLCGETTSSYVKSKILEGNYDCIVSTAGAFVEFLKYPGVSISNFSVIVFDECHHATKKHKYCEILQKVEASTHRPRLLGLSASPVTGKDYSQIYTALENLKLSFLDAIIYKPNSLRKEPEYTWNIVRYSEEQKTKVAELQGELLELCLRIQSSSDNQKDFEWFNTVPLPAILSWAHDLDPRPKANDLRHLARINRDFEINKLLGPAYIDSDADHQTLDSAQLSPFLVKLEEIIRSLPETSRILVFVDQKLSAKMIQSRLLSTFAHLNPCYIVGNTGWDGMTWKQQNEILQKFNRRDVKASEQVRLIVSTSVLEEGLDVQGCDAVFRFGGRSSLIQFVQSRGRARTGKMYVILTDEDRLFIDNILKEEQILNHAFLSESRQSDQKIEEYFPKFNLTYPESDNLDLSELEYYLEEDPDGQPVALKFYANCPHDSEIRRLIIRELKSLGCISSVSYISFDFGQAAVDSGSRSLFEIGDSTIQVNVAIDSSILEFFRYLISVWQFSVALTKTRFFDVYMPLPSTLLTEEAFPKSITEVSDIITVDVGFLTGRRSYEIMHRLGSDSLEYKSLSISANLHWKLLAQFQQDPNSMIEIQSPISSLAHFAFASADQNGRTFTIFLFVKYTPTLLVSKGDKTTRISCPHEEVSVSDDWPYSLAQEELRKIADTPLFAVTFPLHKWDHVLSMISSKTFGLKVYFTKLIIQGQIGVNAQKRQSDFAGISERFWRNISPIDLTLSEKKIIFSLYSLSSFLHEMILNPTSYHEIKMDIFQLLLTGIEDQSIRMSHQVYLNQLREILDNLPVYFQKKTLWTDCHQIFSSLMEKMQSSDTQKQQTNDLIDLDGYRSVYRILITPSSVIFRPAYLIKSNRLLRKFESEEFAYVSFVDEDTNPIFNSDVFRERYKYFLIHGIRIESISFAFLLCSASQQREQRAIFVSGDSTLAQSLRDQIAPFSHFKGDIAKYMSRLGLFCTADTFVTSVTESIQQEPDIYTHQNNRDIGKNLVDGAGKISPKMLELVREKHLSRKPFCAFQFRYSGAKGVLYQCDNLTNCEILLRESNVKFECPESDLCLVQPALFNPVKLNREMLNLLFSFSREGQNGGKWDPFPYVRKLQRAELLSMGEIFLDPEKALAALTERLQSDDLTCLTRKGFDLFEDHFVLKMLTVLYKYRCRMLRSKVHIPLQRGAYLMGIPDPTGILKDGEVFYQIQDPSRPSMVGSGRQLVYRNPCLDPGDLRLVTAVDIPELRSYFNVLIFPASIDCLRSLSAECSGGDLDGDMFSIISDESLIPPGEFQAIDYELIAKEAKASANRPSSHLDPQDLQTRVASFIIRAMTNSNLGRIARLHLALCDALPLQAADPLARELARSQSLAVDFVKTGVPPHLPEEAKWIVKKNGYPSFMENKTRISYISQKPLGILYDDVISGVCEFTMDRKLLDENRSYIDGSIDPHELFHLPGKEEYEAEGLSVYTDYCSLISGILSRFSLKSDAELVLGLPETLSPELLRDQGAVEQSLYEIWVCVKQKYRKIFQTEGVDLLLKASAWHYVAYTTPPYFLSFSWILSDYLLLIAEQNDSIVAKTPTNIFMIVGESVLKYWHSIREELNEVVDGKLGCFQYLQDFICTQNLKTSYDLKLYGSVALLLCDEDSDLDIYVMSTESEGEPSTKFEQLILLRDFAPLLEPIASSLNVNDVPAVPIIRGSFRTPSVENQVVDFSACIDGLSKASYIRSFYAQSSCNIVIMNSLMNWARCCRLIPVSNDVEGDNESLRKGEFHAFVLSILYPIDNSSAVLTEPTPQLTPKELILENSLCPQEIGEKLIQFFRLGQEVPYETDFIFRWPVKGSPIHIIKADMMKRVTIACSRAYHCLVRSRDWSFLQLNAIARDLAETTTVIQIPLNSILANHLLKASRWHIMALENASKATVRISATDLHCEVEGRGTRLQIMNLRSVFRKFYQRSKHYLSGFLRSNCGAYFMANSSLLYCRDVYSILSKVTFEAYLGPKHDQHSLGELCRVIRCQQQIRDSMDESQQPEQSSWRDEYKKIIKEKFLHQLEALILQPNEKITVSIHFGTFYTVNASECFGSHKVTLNDLTQAHLRGREMKDREKYDESILPMIFNYMPQEKSSEDDTSTIPEMPNLSSSSSTSSCGSSLSESQKSRKISRLSTSFWNSIVNWRNISGSSDRVVSTLGNVYRGLGYTVRAGDEGGVPPKENTEWKATFILSPSYIAEVKYSNDINLPSYISEKPLSWINATLLSGTSFLPSDDQPTSTPSSSLGFSPSIEQNLSSADILVDHDLRLKVCTVNKLEPDDAIYRCIFPPTTSSPKKEDAEFPPGSVEEVETSKALFSLNSQGHPVPRDSKVNFVRRVNYRVIYDYAEPNSPDDPQSTTSKIPEIKLAAIVSCVDHFLGENLSGMISGYDLALDVEVGPLLLWLEKQVSDQALLGWVDKLADHMFLVSDAINASASSPVSL